MLAPSELTYILSPVACPCLQGTAPEEGETPTRLGRTADAWRHGFGPTRDFRGTCRTSAGRVPMAGSDSQAVRRTNLFTIQTWSLIYLFVPACSSQISSCSMGSKNCQTLRGFGSPHAMLLCFGSATPFRQPLARSHRAL